MSGLQKHKKYYEDAKGSAEIILEIKQIKKGIEHRLNKSDKEKVGRQPGLSSHSLMLQEKPYTHDVLLKELTTDEELNEIRAYLDRPLYERIKWTKGDYIVVFISTIMGMGIEYINLRWRPNSPLDKDGKWNKWFDKKLHNHEKGYRCPIDFQEPRPEFNHKSHRVRSRGHDISQFFEGIKQVMDGEYRGARWIDATRIDVIEHATKNGTEYLTKDWYAAFVTLVGHLFADFFSAHSLPVPLSSRVYENGNEETRTFIHNLYENGYNLRQLALNSTEVFLAILTIKIWLWWKYGFGNRKKPEIRLQEYEMRTAVMGTLAGANLAECAVFRNPYLLNIPVLISTIDSTVQMLHRKMDRNSMIMKAQRNMDDILAAYQELLLDEGN